MNQAVPYQLTASHFTEQATLYYYDHDSVNPDDASRTIFPMTLYRATDGWDAVYGELSLFIPDADVERLCERTDAEGRTLFADYEEALAHKLHRESHRIARIRAKSPQDLLEPLYQAWKDATPLSRHERKAYEDALARTFDFTPR